MLELELINDDKNTHCAVLPSNGDNQFIWLVNHSKGTATLELDGPGYYWYGSRTGNDEGRGLTAAIVVGGDAPPRRASTAHPSRARSSTVRLNHDSKGALMATEYVDAGKAVDNSALSGIVGSAPPVTKGVTYERILNARSEPHNWLTYYGAYDGQRYSPLDQINKETSSGSRPRGSSSAARWACTRASRRTRSRPPRSSSTASCSSPAGTAGSGRSTPGPERCCGSTGTRPYDVSLCCGNVNRGVAVAEGKVFVPP